MSKEKVILSFVAVTVGLVVAGTGFYFYQGTKLPSEKQHSSIAVNPSPTPKSSVSLSLDEPKDEAVFDNRVVKISGKTDPGAMIVILTDSDEQVLNPSVTGEFSTTTTIDRDATVLKITAIAKNGDTNTIERTVTYSTESF